MGITRDRDDAERSSHLGKLLIHLGAGGTYNPDSEAICPVTHNNRSAADMRTVVKLSPLTGAIIGGLLSMNAPDVLSAESFCPKGRSPDPSVIWCDSFEDADLGPKGTVGENYYEFDTNNGDHARTNRESFYGSYSLRARWQQGEVDAGHLIRNFGRNPLGSQSHADRNFQEIYWRFYVKYQTGFVGYPDKLSRTTSFANSSWAQAMIAHLWKPRSNPEVLSIDPATGISTSGQLVTTKWNDFANLRWLGMRDGTTRLEPGRWYCVETHVKLNTPGISDGIFEFRVDDYLEARRNDLNWRGTWTAYGINSIFMENYWNAGSPAQQERYIDALVISEKPIGCIGEQVRPNPPANLVTR